MTDDPTDNDPCFVAFASCGHMVFASVDSPDRKAENAREVAHFIRIGCRVTTMTAAEVRVANWCPSTCERRRKKGRK